MFLTDPDDLLNTALAALTEFMGVRHALVLLKDSATRRLYTVASRGYANSGVGSAGTAPRGSH